MWVYLSGCNLSPILFSLYIMDLSYRLTATRRGPNIRGTCINNLLFADDLVMMADSAINMQVLISVLSIWMKDFKMTISKDQTQIITSPDEQWRFYSFEEEAFIGIDQVNSYKYLGVRVTRHLKTTTNKMEESLIKRATTYARAILRIRDWDLEIIKTSLELWTKMALPRFLYATEVMPFSAGAISKLQVIQNQLARRLLGVQGSSANVLIPIDLGLRSITGRLYKRKLGFYTRVCSDAFNYLII